LTMNIKSGDVFRHVLAGGGGYGDPLERDPAAVLRDVRNEVLSPAKAAADYGVVIDTRRWTVDVAATRTQRASIAAARAWRTVPKGQREEPPSPGGGGSARKARRGGVKKTKARMRRKTVTPTRSPPLRAGDRPPPSRGR